MTTDTLRQVFGTLRTPNGSPFPNKSLKWFRERRTAVAQGSSVVLDDPFIVTTDAVGEIDTSVMAGAYLVLAPLSDADRYFRVVVPDQAGPFDISSLIDGPTVEPDELTQFEALVAKAKAWANAPEDSVVESGEFSAKHYAAKAEEWAKNPEDVQVEAGQYSAKHWAAKSEDEKLAAQQARTGAELAETNAEIARDAAFVNANVYADTTAGLAATTTGQQFQVVSGDEIIRYRHDAGPVANEVARYPAAAKVDPLLSSAPSGFSYSVVDGAGLAAFGVDDSGVLVANDARIDRLESSYIGSVGGGLTSGGVPGFAFAFLDSLGTAAGGVRDSGTLSFADIEADRLNGVSVEAIIAGGGSAAPLRSPRRFSAEVNMVASYGQSLANGTDSIPPISVTQRFDNLRFAGGVRTADSSTPYTDLVPLIETANGTFGETPIAGATDMIKEMLQVEDGLSPGDHIYQMLGTAPGVPAQAIASLSKGSGAYTRVINDCAAGYSLCQARGSTFSMPAFFWTQGESDYQSNTDPGIYYLALVQLRNDLDADIKLITGQADHVVCISYQTAAHVSYGHTNDSDIAVAQWKVARDNPHHYIACPLYWSPQTIHQSPENSKRLGAYYGLCYKRVVINQEEWKPLEPISLLTQGSIVLVEFNVPHGVLVFDNTTINPRTNAGFQIFDGATEIGINSVSITGPNTIKIVAASAVPSGAKLKYGQGNPGGGNLRDQQGDAIVFDGGGLNFPMHNWCVIFEELL